MNLLSGILMIGILAIIFIQDFKDRKVTWFLFPLLLSIALFRLWKLELLVALSSTIAINLIIVLLLITCVWLYFNLRLGKTVNLIGGYLGLGDILFWLVLCFLFSPLNFLTFFIISLILSLILHAIFRSYKVYGSRTHIPLAGFQSLFLIFVTCLNYSHQLFDPFNDDWVHQFLKSFWS